MPRLELPPIPEKELVAEEELQETGNYFVDVVRSDKDFIHSGCTVLNCVLGGGWPLGRISNIVGNKSSGKTLLAIEACANCHIQFPNSKIYYLEAESAFDPDYARALGMPIDVVEFIETGADSTVETLFEALEDVLEEHEKSKNPGLFIVDSLDALSDRAELARKIDEGTYGGKKPKQLSELFRRLTGRIEKSKIHLMIISQIRDNIGVTYGSKVSRSGGHALDFYASQIIWLNEKGKIKKTIRKVERIIGIEISANCKKNKVGLPFRTCELPIYFGYGINDIEANLDYLNSIQNGIGSVADILNIPDPIPEKLETRRLTSLKSKLLALPKAELQIVRKGINEAVIQEWQDLEQEFMPTSSKY